MNGIQTAVESTGVLAPWLFLLLFIAASLLMIWRLEIMTAGGVEGTVLGTLVMPYCSGMGNLIFAFILASKGGRGEDVVVNSIVNNVTNLTLLIGLPTLIWGMNITGRGGGRKSANPKEGRIHRLSLLLTISAGIFFTGAVWALARDRKLDTGDGLVLVGIFLFWQLFHIIEVLKTNVRQNRTMSFGLLVNLALLAVGAVVVYVSTNWLVGWISNIEAGFISARNLGWLSGWLMVLPNAILAFYYARRGNPEVVYTSQIGDGHVCIPLCIGIFALQRPAGLPAFFETGVVLLVAASAVHFLFTAVFGRLPRWMGGVLVGLYVVFLYKGLLPG